MQIKTLATFEGEILNMIVFFFLTTHQAVYSVHTDERRPDQPTTL